MCQSKGTSNQSPHPGSQGRPTEEYTDIGQLFRSHGQRYIQSYGVNTDQIRFIKDVTKCKTPALGGVLISCKTCDQKTYLYKSCGNSQCPKCQSIKRLQWQDKLSSKILKCPYQHIIFTLPHELNYIANVKTKLVYNALFKAAWNTLSRLSKSKTNLGATPGMVAVLHTFGSDLKHHIHLHTLVTFGGIDKMGEWRFPTRKNKIAPYRQMCSTFRKEYLKILHKSLEQEDLESYEQVQTTLSSLANIRWCVHNTPPTMHTKIIEEYLGRYVCRIGVSNKKLKYDDQTQEVQLEYNDYKNQEKNKAAPKAIKHIDPLVAIHQILRHVLPSHFQKVRYYGLMTTKNQKQICKNIPDLLRQDKNCIRKLFEILRALLQLDDGEQEIGCISCGAQDLAREEVKPDPVWYNKHIAWKQKGSKTRNRSPDNDHKTYHPPKNKPLSQVAQVSRALGV